MGLIERQVGQFPGTHQFADGDAGVAAYGVSGRVKVESEADQPAG